MDTKDERIRQRAYSLWELEGRPDGRAEAHWDAAAEWVAMEENDRPAAAPSKPERNDLAAKSDSATTRPANRER